MNELIKDYIGQKELTLYYYINEVLNVKVESYLPIVTSMSSLKDVSAMYFN